jgi:hypothetical protein
MAALCHAGRGVSYDAVLGLSGIALLPPPQMSPAPGDPFWEAYEALSPAAGVGMPTSVQPWVSRVAEAVGGLAGEVRAPLLSAQEALEAVRTGVDGGFAVPLRGWPEGQEAWSVATGYDPARGVICGWPPEREEDTYLGAAPRGSAAVILRATESEKLPRTKAAVTALGHWAEAWVEGWSRYGAWLDWLAQAAPEGDRRPVMAAHHAAAEGLADARTAAASFARTCAGLLGGGEGMPELERAADNLARVVEVLEAGPPALTAETEDGWPAWLEGWSDALTAARRHDDAAHGEARAALALLL